MYSIDYGKYTRLISEKFGFFSPNCHFKRFSFDHLTTFDNHNLVCTESIYTLEDLSIYLVKTLITFTDDKKSILSRIAILSLDPVLGPNTTYAKNVFK